MTPEHNDDITVDVDAVHIWAQLMFACADDSGHIRQHEATCPVGWVWPLIREVDQLRSDVAYLRRREAELQDENRLIMSVLRDVLVDSATQCDSPATCACSYARAYRTIQTESKPRPTTEEHT